MIIAPRFYGLFLCLLGLAVLPGLLNAQSNVAQGKTATQSSTYPGFAGASPASAVDGNTDGIFGDGSVTATNLDVNPWWQVDLATSAAVSSIVIWNRTDCCSDRLGDYWVFISDTPFLATDTPATLAGRAGTFGSHQTTAPSPVTTITAGAQGRYVRVQLSGANYLSLAEVQVMGTLVSPGVNLATGRPATQSSTLPGYMGAGPASAVDGNTDGNFGNGSVTATNLDVNAWWQVDLGGPATVNAIVIFNRTDCCGLRLNDYWVFVSNTPFNPTDTPFTLQNRPGTFSSHQSVVPNPSVTIGVGGAQGRYVRVQLTSANILSLAEVQVLGLPSSPNLAINKAATQSSTLAGSAAIPSAAVDGNTDGNFGNGSVTATNFEGNPWWQVDLGSPANISSIVIFNRTDCCGDRLSDYWIFVSNTPFGPSDTPTTLQNRPGVTLIHQTTTPNPSSTIVVGAQGQYVRVQLAGTNYLSLAEVQVFGTAPPPISSNLAQGKMAAQSSTFSGYPTAASQSAVDGFTDGAFFDGSVTATNSEANAWWQVDLGASVTVSSVVIWNRTDACCANRLNDYWVFVSNTPFLPTDTPATLQNQAGIFASHQTTAPNPSTTISVAAPGRYVRVQLSGMDYLSLAEVQVFGQ